MESLFILIFKINVFSCSVFEFIGILFGIVVLVVFSRAKNFAPKIACRKYLIIQTISNLIFLLLRWYIMTLPGFLDIFQIEDETIFLKIFVDVINKNVYVCKLLNYFHSVSQSFSLLITLIFSLERLLAIYFPLKMIKFNKSPFNYIMFLFLIIFSFSLSVHILFNYELIGEKCFVNDINNNFHAKLSAIIYIINIIFPFFVIIIVNVAIVIKLKYSERKMSSYCEKNINKNPWNITQTCQRSHRQNKDTFNEISEEKISLTSQIGIKRFSNVEHNKISDIKCQKATNENFDKNQKQNPSNKYSYQFHAKKDCMLNIDFVNKKIVKNSSFHSNDSQISPLRKGYNVNTNNKTGILKFKLNDYIICDHKLFLTKKTFYNTKIIITLSSLYVIFNLPYYLNFLILYCFNASMENIKLHMYLMICELFYVAYYSLNGLLLFIFGKMYRLHLNHLIKSILYCFKF